MSDYDDYDAPICPDCRAEFDTELDEVIVQGEMHVYVCPNCGVSIYRYVFDDDEESEDVP